VKGGKLSIIKTKNGKKFHRVRFHCERNDTTTLPRRDFLKKFLAKRTLSREKPFFLAKGND